MGRVAAMKQVDDQKPLSSGPLPAKRESHAALFFDAADRLFLVKVTYGSDPWRFPGGVAEADEAPRATVRREVEEELASPGTPVRCSSSTGNRHRTAPSPNASAQRDGPNGSRTVCGSSSTEEC
jgi:8-oxo-dGTP pyrophosphatase MutT (NUDIX family)